MTDLEIIEEALRMASQKGCYNAIEAKAIRMALENLKKEKT